MNAIAQAAFTHVLSNNQDKVRQGGTIMLNAITTVTTYGSLGHSLESPMEYQQLTGKEKEYNAQQLLKLVLSILRIMEAMSSEMKTD